MLRNRTGEIRPPFPPEGKEDEQNIRRDMCRDGLPPLPDVGVGLWSELFFKVVGKNRVFSGPEVRQKCYVVEPP